MSHYETLGLGPDASPEEIKAAYRRLSRKHHPDKGGDKEAFQRIKAAYEALTGKAGPDNSHAQMLERVSGLFLAAVEACDDPSRYDIVERVKSSLQHVLRELAQQILSTRCAIVKREKILKRLRGRRPEDTFLHGLIERDIARHNKSIAELEAEGPKVQEVIDFLKNYDYEFSAEAVQTEPTVYRRLLLGDWPTY